MVLSPFPTSAHQAGRGEAHLTASPSQFRTLSYAYPLKLISSPPILINKLSVHTLFILTYGGGLVAGDTIDLGITLNAYTRLNLLTQGSTKIFRLPDGDSNITLLTTQLLCVRLLSGSALCYLPDPAQPFADSAFEQTQRYVLSENASFCVCDWVSGGRLARGEKWDFWRYVSRNEVYDANHDGEPRLLLRDNLALDRRKQGIAELGGLAAAVDHMGVVCTLILHGPVFRQLANYLQKEYADMPRVGEKKWDQGKAEQLPTLDSYLGRRGIRQLQERSAGLLWTVASVRDFVLVKFAAREVDGAKIWLRSMLQEDGSVEREFGERSLMCLR